MVVWFKKNTRMFGKEKNAFLLLSALEQRILIKDYIDREGSFIENGKRVDINNSIFNKTLDDLVKYLKKSAIIFTKEMLDSKNMNSYFKEVGNDVMYKCQKLLKNAKEEGADKEDIRTLKKICNITDINSFVRTFRSILIRDLKVRSVKEVGDEYRIKMNIDTKKIKEQFRELQECMGGERIG